MALSLKFTIETEFLSSPTSAGVFLGGLLQVVMNYPTAVSFVVILFAVVHRQSLFFLLILRGLGIKDCVASRNVMILHTRLFHIWSPLEHGRLLKFDNSVWYFYTGNENN